MPDVVVVGAGLSGLAAGVTLADAGVDVLVLDGESAPGGVIRSEERDGFLFEHAVPGVLAPHPATAPLAARAGVTLEPARAAAARRALLLGGKLVDVPAAPLAALRSPLLSLPAKARLLAEPLAPKASGDDTVYAFIHRHLGAEFAERLAQPLVSGVFAGDAHRLSAAACFPALVGLEDAGGLIRGGLRRLRAAHAAGQRRPALAAPAGGMQALTDALADALGSRVRLATPAAGVARYAAGWRVHTPAGALDAAAVIVAAAPWHAAGLLAAVDTTLAAHLRDIRGAPVAVVGLTSDALPGPERFGFLAGPGEALGALGVLVESWAHTGRAPAGKHLLRVLVGGARDPEAVDLDDDAMFARAERAVRRGLGAAGDLRPFAIVRHRPGIPQYEVGHLARLEAVGERLARLRGLNLSGWGYRGVGANAVVADAVAVARRFIPPGRAGVAAGRA